jgi:hypothetical protein
MKKNGPFLVLLATAAAAAPLPPSLTCTLHPGRLGERQELVCALQTAGQRPSAASAAATTHLLVLALPLSVGPDSAWLATGAVAGTGGVVACGAGVPQTGAPASPAGVGPCPALGGFLAGGGADAADAAATSLVLCVPPTPATTPTAATAYFLTTPLHTACADEAVAARARPALVVARGVAGAEAADTATTATATDTTTFRVTVFRVTVRARLARPDPASWLGSTVTVRLPPPFIAAFHAANGSLAGVVAAAAAGGPDSLGWDVPAPGGRAGPAVGAATAAAALAAASSMIQAVARGGGGAGARVKAA